METLIRPLKQFIERVNGPFSCPAPLTWPSCIYFLSLSWPRMHHWWQADPLSCQNIFTDVASGSDLFALPQKWGEERMRHLSVTSAKTTCLAFYLFIYLSSSGTVEHLRSARGRWRDFSDVNEQLKRATWRVFLPKACQTEIADIC